MGEYDGRGEGFNNSNPFSFPSFLFVVVANVLLVLAICLNLAKYSCSAEDVSQCGNQHVVH